MTVISAKTISKEEFFSLLWQRCMPDWHVEIRGTQNKDFTGKIISTWTQIGNLQELYSAINQLTQTTPHNVHYVVCPRKHPSGKKQVAGEENLAAIPAFWVDVDCAVNWADKYLKGKKALQLQKLGLIPNIYVSSGWGVHLFWLLNSPVTDSKTGEQCNKILANLFQGDLQASNWAHTLRAPGSYNCKVVPIRPVEAHLITDQRYDTQKLVHTLEHFAKLTKTEAVKTTSSHNSTNGLKQKRNFENNGKKYQKDTFLNKNIDYSLLLNRSECPIIRKALDLPNLLSYVEWFSIGAGLYKVFGLEGGSIFHYISQLDTVRYSFEETTRKWKEIAKMNYMPYNCSKLNVQCPLKISEGRKCSNLVTEFRRLCKRYTLQMHRSK